MFLRGFGAGAGAGALGAEPATRPDWVRLLPVAQVLAFVAVEVAERVAVGASLADLGPVLILGLPLQVLAGIAGGWVLAAAARAGARLARALAPPPAVRPPPAEPRLAPAHLCSRPSPSSPAGRPPARGPPPLLVPV